VQRIEAPPSARAEAITATVATGILLGASIFTSLRANEKTSEANELAANHAEATQWNAANDSADRWHDLSYTLIGATIISVGVSGYLWSRAAPHYQVVPTSGGAMVGFTSSW